MTERPSGEHTKNSGRIHHVGQLTISMIISHSSVHQRVIAMNPWMYGFFRLFPAAVVHPEALTGTKPGISAGILSEKQWDAVEEVRAAGFGGLGDHTYEKTHPPY